MNADGSEQVDLTNDAWWDGNPSWSPDGTKIAAVEGGIGRQLRDAAAVGVHHVDLGTFDPGPRQ